MQTQETTSSDADQDFTQRLLDEALGFRVTHDRLVWVAPHPDAGQSRPASDAEIAMYVLLRLPQEKWATFTEPVDEPDSGTLF